MPGRMVSACTKKLGKLLRTFGIQTIHHPAGELQLILQAEVDEICVYEDSIWWYKFCVVGKEHR